MSSNRKNGMAPEVWLAPDEMRDHREALGLSVEQAAARIAAAAEFDRFSPRWVQEALKNIESGLDGFVSIAMNEAIKLGLGLRNGNLVSVQGRLLAGALRRSGMSSERATQTLQQYPAPMSVIAEAVEALQRADRIGEESPGPKCSVGKGLIGSIDSHSISKHRGVVTNRCEKCVGLLARAQAHEADCDQCLANTVWMDNQKFARQIAVPLEAAQALAAVLGLNLHRLTAPTAHQRRQLFGISTKQAPKRSVVIPLPPAREQAA